MPYGPVIDPGDTIWNRGYVFGTKQGGTNDGIPLGEMMDFQLKDTLNLKEVEGASSLGAVAVGISSRKVTGSAKWLKVRANQFVMARGGTVTVASSVTTYSAGVNDEPTPFQLHFMTPSDGSNTELKVYGCVAPDLTLPLAQRDFAIPDLTFNVYGNGTNFYQLLRAGDQTQS